MNKGAEQFSELPDVRAIEPGDRGYDEARQVWNAMIDQRPSTIVPCRSAADVAAAIRAARAVRQAVSVRGGGHNIAGTAVRDGALMVDLSPMRDVEIDGGSRVARVGGGATLADLDRAAQAHALATPAGVVSDTGVGGLTLGGGFGWLSRQHGLAADNLLAADVVLADGSRVRASATEEPELFWAIRGGGGNFGVVTAFEFRLHPVGPEVLFGPVFHRLDDAPAVLRHWADFMAGAPRACGCWADLGHAPPAPFLPEEVHGQKVLILMHFWAGGIDAGEAALAPLRTFGDPLGDAVAPRPYVEAQSFLDQTYARGARNYWGSHNVPGMTDDAIRAYVDIARTLPTGESDILLCALGGAIDDVAPEATAYPHRGVPFMSSHGARWRDAAQDAAMVGWAKQASARLAPHVASGAYVNFIAEPEGRVGEAYGGNRARLAAAKARYDPDNVFRVNQNVAPAAD